MRTRLIAALLLALCSCAPAAAQNFVFAQFSDNHGEGNGSNGSLPQISAAINALGVNFVIFAGDVTQDTAVSSTTFRAAMNGGSTPGNGLFNKTFAIRGNHDQTGTWIGYFDFATAASNIGATNFATHDSATVCGLDNCQAYSFDYSGWHFAFFDQSGLGISSLPDDQVTWMGTDLTAAEARGIQHEVLVYHGPTYWTEASHSSTASNHLLNVLNAHAAYLAAIFHGHEHMQSYRLLDSTKSQMFCSGWAPGTPCAGQPTMTTSIYEIQGGPTDTDWYDCQANRVIAGKDWEIGNNTNCPGLSTNNVYSVATVNGGQMQVKFYKCSGGNCSAATLSNTLTFGQVGAPTARKVSHHLGGGRKTQ